MFDQTDLHKWCEKNGYTLLSDFENHKWRDIVSTGCEDSIAHYLEETKEDKLKLVNSVFDLPEEVKIWQGKMKKAEFEIITPIAHCVEASSVGAIRLLLKHGARQTD